METHYNQAVDGVTSSHLAGRSSLRGSSRSERDPINRNDGFGEPAKSHSWRLVDGVGVIHRKLKDVGKRRFRPEMNFKVLMVRLDLEQGEEFRRQGAGPLREWDSQHQVESNTTARAD